MKLVVKADLHAGALALNNLAMPGMAASGIMLPPMGIVGGLVKRLTQ